MKRGFTLVELLVSVAIVAVLVTLVGTGGWRVYQNASLAVSANNLHQLSVGATAYLSENNHVFWKYREPAPSSTPGTIWWFGYESSSSSKLPEGKRKFDPNLGPLGGYVPAGMRPDPSFGIFGKAFKPKYESGYLGIGYNVQLGGGWLGTSELKRYWNLEDPGKTVVFSTSAQVNVFQKPASGKNPMLEEFYGLEKSQATVHFRHHGKAMVIFANGTAEFIPIDESTQDKRMEKAKVGKLSPEYLE